MSETEVSDDISKEDTKYKQSVRWVIPNRLDQMTFVGKDVFAVAHDVYIMFFNYKTDSELVYLANSKTTGDGVDVIAGHRSNLFAFAEKVNHGRIFIVAYPRFNIMAELQDMEINRYKGLCMMECDLIAGFSGFPNYVVTVWNWRTNQRLIIVETGIKRRQQIYMASRTHMLLCECYSEGLIVWEVAQCFKKCFLMRRDKHEVTGWEVSEPPLIGIAWASDGQLFAIDPNAVLYSVLSDGINMVTTEEWNDKLVGPNKPTICAFQNGLLIFGPDLCLRSIKKCEGAWKVVWSHIPNDPVERLVSNSTFDMATMWTNNGFIFKITGDSEENIDVTLFAFKQRHIKKIQLFAPDYEHVACINEDGLLCIYEIATARIVRMKYFRGNDVSIAASPTEPLLMVYGEVGNNYGMVLHSFNPEVYSKKISRTCLTNQIVSLVAFSPSGREVVAAAMSAGHIFIFKLSEEYKLTLVRYAELGRGLADCFLMPVGDSVRCFSLVLFSDKYLIGERVVCVNVETGKDNKFAGKMQGPYAKFLPLGTKDTIIGIPHLTRQYHVLKLSGDKGVTVAVKMGPIIDTGHDIKQFDGFMNKNALITYAFDGSVILRTPDAPEEYELKIHVTHRYEKGIKEAVIDANNQYIVHLGGNRTLACTYITDHPVLAEDLVHDVLEPEMYDRSINSLKIIGNDVKNYLETLEDKRVHQETVEYRREREEVVKNFEKCRKLLIELLEENIAERPLHQLSLSEFNLHMEAKKERLKQAEREREEIRLTTEARIRAQDKVTAWIKKTCWDAMLTQRVKMFAIFSHYHVENFAVLPTQRDKWPELQQIEELRAIEMENDHDLFRPWEEPNKEEVQDQKQSAEGSEGSAGEAEGAVSSHAMWSPHVLAGTSTHRFVSVPRVMVPQTLAFSFLQMNWLQHLVKLNTQNMRLWFNKQFDDLMGVKKREVGLVEERNNRLRFIIDELNKLSNLRGSFHHFVIAIKDPEWRQEEHTHKLIKVEPEECSIEPYISPSQVVIIPPDPGPKDDFRERALIEMMDGVLEKLWHEEIKKPIPKPQCMLDKDPEHFNEEDLRHVFDYEAKVAFRNEEREKYRKMLHAEYAKLSQVLNEGIVKFNMRVKEMWITKLKVDSVIGQENLNLMRLRRVNLDRVEMAELLEDMRTEIARFEHETAELTAELEQMQEQYTELQTLYDTHAVKDRQLDKTFKNHFADLSPIIVDHCYKFFRKRPKWHQRSTLIPTVLRELAHAVLTGVRPALLHPDCVDYFKGMEQLDLISNMPQVLDETMWNTMCKLRRAKAENEIQMRALSQEVAYVESAHGVWNRAISARRDQLATLARNVEDHRVTVELLSRNKTLQLVLPAGQVEITTTGHMCDFDDATLIPREDIEKINEVILKVGDIKLRMMRKQMEFRKGILAKEWEHAQMKMKLRHMEQELYSYQRLKIPKELQRYLKEKEQGYTDEQDYQRLEKEMEAAKQSVNKILTYQIQRVEEIELKLNALQAQRDHLEALINKLITKVSEKRLRDDPLEPIRIRRVFKRRMDTLVMRSQLIREVQENHCTIARLQTELELMRLKTYPTLAAFQTY